MTPTVSNVNLEKRVADAAVAIERLIRRAVERSERTARKTGEAIAEPIHDRTIDVYDEVASICRVSEAIHVESTDFRIPRVTTASFEAHQESFAIEPLDRGFGYTFGNSLRRVLLSSLAGAAVTSVRIEGVAHEFSTIKGVTEDISDIVLNLKGIVCRMHSDATEVEAPLVVTGPGEITAQDIDLPAGVEILNPDVHIATLEKKTKLELYLTIGRGRGYQPAEENKSPDQPIGVIPIDSIFSPVRRVAYAVEQARVGQRTDYDKLTLDIETDGSIDPQAALREAAEILISQLAIFTNPANYYEVERGGSAVEMRTGTRALLDTSHWAPEQDILIEELELGVRSYNHLKRAGIQTVGDLISKSEGELNAIPNFGKKSIDEVLDALHSRGLDLQGEREARGD
jgi:DNA-directed RNA polymerase subunit alpha